MRTPPCDSRHARRRVIPAIGLLSLLALLAVIPFAPGRAAAAATCARTITADVVAIDQPFFWNRLGAAQPHGMMYALRRDVVPISGTEPGAGNATLRLDKRPRPIVLRMNVGDCLTIKFTNWLAPSPVNDEQPATRAASVRVIGMQLVGGIASDGSNVGANASSLVPPGGSASYTLHAEREGGYLLYSGGAIAGGEGDGGSIPAGLFGAVNVQPRGAEWYRSQVTAQELAWATTGTTPGGQPTIDYNAVYPAGHAFAGQPILKMLHANAIIHSDLNAVITGPGAGRLPSGTYRPNPTLPDREQPFREFTVIFHDETGAVQAFPIFEDGVWSHTLHGVRDGFAINYGSAGAGAEILANRFGVGPMHDCQECKYEEFFLTSWAVGDPAMVVDVPANATDASGNLVTGPKATKAFYPDDPANVHHSYLGDHVKFRNIHAGPKEHHIFHLHAHQWLHTPDSDNSTYLDSQHIGPGSGFTYEIANNGSGNRNKTPGDSIFHCHFYPHFAQGMWGLWRTHDVFEPGTVLDADGRPAPGSRALPDAEILAGVPIPAIVPVPTVAMPPMPAATARIRHTTVLDGNGDPVLDGNGDPVTQPTGQVEIVGDGNPGYPFFIPGVAGHRPPTPPLDAVDTGGLPRHVILGGSATAVTTRTDMSKTLVTAQAMEVPETGTPVEQAAMAFHAQRLHPSYRPDGTAADFVANGLPPAPGAPFADPCVSGAGLPAGAPRLYKSASVQIDMKLNKAGWHFSQSRLNVLWDDVAAVQGGLKPPEPLFFRANTGDCVSFYHANLVPPVYEQDDFQVRTPTDVVGTHIHLVKFDVTASDGSANGWNYEDGTFSPGEVLERIHAINDGGGMTPYGGGAPYALAAQPHPYFGIPGARTTVQRWYVDNVLNNAGRDRTLRSVFSHDHFSPSTHQQVGLYSTLVAEPQGSQWRDPETGAMLGSRQDGGPTSWRADILTANAADSYREFMLMMTDFVLAYRPDGTPVNPPAREEVGLPFLVRPAPDCPGGAPLPCPEAISAEDVGTMVVNYRNEPLALRVRDPNTNTQAPGEAGDLSHAFRSDVLRADAALNTQPTFYPPLTAGVQPGDPFTPLIRAYENDKAQIRILGGGQEESHNFSVQGGGARWLFEPTDPNSGFRASQDVGISQHFAFVLPPLVPGGDAPHTDLLYRAGSAVDDLWNGIWGIIRQYRGPQPDLLALPNNPNGQAPAQTNPGAFNGICPTTAPVRNFSISAVSAPTALPGGTLVYNSRPGNGGPLHDPTAILYVHDADLDAGGMLQPGAPIEPLILRARAGDCINVTLTNRLPAVLPDLPGYSTLPMIVEDFNTNQVAPSNHVGLHAQLLATGTDSFGVNAGFNPVQTVAPGGATTYKWYAGTISVMSNGFRIGMPIEFGAVNLLSSDPIKHSNKGAIGALIIEPRASTWVEDAGTRAAATVTKSDGTSFREFVVLFQDDVNLRNDNGAVPNLDDAEDPEDSGQKALNYRTEPFWKRMGFAPDTPLDVTRTLDFGHVLSNSQVGGDPETPVFTAKAGTPVRFRVLHPGGHARNHVFQLHGHVWQEEPYTASSTVIGNNPLSEWKGSQAGHGPTNHFDAVLQNGAGGAFGVPGDYLFRDQASFQFGGGLWGIFRVVP